MSGFVARHKQDWQELETLVHRGRKSLRKLTPEELSRLDQLYRRTTVHLARVVSWTQDRQLTNYLNELIAAAHSLIYLPPRRSLWKGVVRFVVEGFARAIARNWPAHLFSAVLMFGGAIVGYGAAMSDPILAHALWPAQDVRQPGATQEQLLSVLRSGREHGGGVKFLFASVLFQHNLKVAFLAMATGVLASVPTIFLMTFNGMLLGVFVAIHYRAGIVAELWAWILPHGITELGAIVLCGGVGLMLGQAVLRPGFRSRRQSLLNAGREAARICLGTAGMLVAAAFIESYVRQSHWSTETRILFATGTGIFWAAYLVHGFVRERQARRGNSEQPPRVLTAGSAVATR